MAYKVSRGTAKPTQVPPEEEERFDTKPSYPLALPLPRTAIGQAFHQGPRFEDEGSRVIDMFPHQKIKVTSPSANRFSDGEPIVPGMLCMGDKVIRKIRPNEIGTVESMYWMKDVNNNDFLKTVFIRFGIKPSLPYEPNDLLKVKVQ